jgi:hypothetical protein
MPSFTLTGPVPGSAAAATGLQPSTLESGVPVQIGTNIQVAAATANTPQTPAFCVAARGDGGDRTLNVTPVPIASNGTITTLTVNLLVSYDGGASWELYASSGAMGGATLPSMQFKNVVAGPLYSLAAATLVLGTATGVNLDGSIS